MLTWRLRSAFSALVVLKNRKDLRTVPALSGGGPWCGSVSGGARANSTCDGLHVGGYACPSYGASPLLRTDALAPRTLSSTGAPLAIRGRAGDASIDSPLIELDGPPEVTQKSTVAFTTTWA